MFNNIDIYKKSKMYKKGLNFKLSILVSFLLSSIIYSQDVVFDDFTDTEISDSLWEFADRTWSAGDEDDPVHGGVVSELASIQDGLLILRGNGEQYTGDIEGHGRNTRVGSCLISKNKYASGSFEFRAKILPREGALSAFWTYDYETYSNADSGNINHEIDIEVKKDDGSFNQALCNTWRYEKVYTSVTNNEFTDQDDGEFHLYRFEWHTGSDTTTPSVSFYYDDELKEVITTTIPTRESNLWIGVWFPTWAGTADFATDSMVVDWVKITPYNESNDETSDEEVVEQEPFYGIPLTMPGIIQAEDFDLGSEGLAYHDDDDGNTGGAYRTDTDVDIEAWSDSTYALGYVVDDEWLEYTINCDSAGDYGTWFNISSKESGGSLHLELDDEQFSDIITFDSTGAWATFNTFSGPILSFPEGEHVLKIYFDEGDINLDWFEIADTTGHSTEETTDSTSTDTLAETSEIQFYEILNNSVKLFPNPVTVSGSVTFISTYEKGVLEIFDLAGNIIESVKSIELGENKFIAPSSAGTYMMRIKSENAFSTSLLVVQ